MPWWWWIIPAIVALLAISIIADGSHSLFRGRHYRAAAGVIGGGTLLAAGVIALLLAVDMQTFHRLTYEQPVATIELKQTGDRRFDATVRASSTETPDETPPRRFDLQGDEWRIEARVLKWKPWVNLFGFDSRYRLERLSGEFLDTSSELSGPRSVYDLRPAPDGNDQVLRIASKFHHIAIVDTLYGSAALMPMTDGAQYAVSLTETGLVARPVNPEAVKAVASWK
jgi:hypothetical protein